MGRERGGKFQVVRGVRIQFEVELSQRRIRSKLISVKIYFVGLSFFLAIN